MPSKGAAEDQSMKNNVLLAQVSHGTSYFTGKKQTVNLTPLADGHSFDLTLITGLFYLDDQGDDGDDFSDTDSDSEVRVYFWPLLHSTSGQCHHTDDHTHIFEAPSRFSECRSWYHFNGLFFRKKSFFDFLAGLFEGLRAPTPYS